MDLAIILALLATAVTIISFVYGFLRNFKYDINTRFDARIDKLEKRMDSLDERMFWLATGKKLEDAILEEKMKRPRTDP